MDLTRRKSPFAYLAFPLFIALTIVLVFIFHDELWTFFRDRNSARDWIRGQGAWGPVAFIGLQIIQVIIFVVPGEVVQIAGGYAFGFWLGSLYTLIGVTIGSIINFYVGRLLGRPFVESIFAKDKIERIESVIGSGKGAAGLFLLFVIPGIPKDILYYVAGISALGMPSFLAVSMVGRLPGILGSSFMGSAAYSGSYRLALLVLVVAGLFFVLGLVFKERIQEFVTKVLKGKG
jgi:uncharacterized membrane protein YdjX (TVP38/TMEM64 family)